MKSSVVIASMLLVAGCAPDEDEELRPRLEIVIDDNGIPHIYGRTDADVFYGAGYQMASDRLFHMETTRRRAYGTLAEVLGQEAQGDDELSRLFDFAGEHRAMYRNVVPSSATQRVVRAFRAELAPACAEIAAAGMAVVTPIAGLTVEAVTRFLVGGFMEVLRAWMEESEALDARDLRDRVAAAFDTVNALLTLPDAARC